MECNEYLEMRDTQKVKSWNWLAEIAVLKSSGRKIMTELMGVRRLSLSLLAAVVFFCSPACRAQTSSSEQPTPTSTVSPNNYEIQQTVEVGYRSDWIGGNQDTYDTFVDLASGPRLLDYTLDMRSINHQGLLFDNLNFSNFGYGGDPNDVSRLRIGKNKLYDFSAMFRRDKYFWDYSLLANPLNPVPFTASATMPAFASTESPHSLDLVHRMQDYDLTLLPQSRVRFRLGYSRYVSEGPALTTEDATDEILMAQDFRMTTNAYRIGVDFKILKRTTLSYDQFLEYNKNDTSDSLASTPFLVQTSQFPGTVPVSLGINWYYPPTSTTTPCAAPLLATGYVNNSNASTSCKIVESYLRTAPTRNFMPIERLSFQSTSIPRLEMSGSASYSNSNNSAPNLYDSINEWTASTTSQVRDSIVSGPADAKEIFVHANWSGIYSLIPKIRIVDSVNYDHWQNPGYNNQTTTDVFATAAPTGSGATGILLPQAQFAPLVAGGSTFASICPSPYTALTCPQHSSSAAADAADTLSSEFAGQRLVSDTLQLEGDITSRITARIGYLYESRQIGNYFASQTLSDIYYPGATTGGTAANDYFAARGSCPYTSGTTTFNPAAGGACTQNADGSVTWAASASTIGSAFNVPRTISTIDEQVGLAGVTWRPMDTLQISSDFEFGYNSYSYTRVWPRQIQSYKVHVSYRPRTWATLDGAVDIHENRDNVYQVDNAEHGRTYSFDLTLTRSTKLTYTLGYNYTDIYLQTFICFDDTFGTMTNVPGGMGLPTFASCPITNTTSNNNQSALAFYTNQQNYVYSDVVWKPVNRVTIGFGYVSTFANGNTLQLDPLEPAGTLDFNYQKPFATIQIDLHKGLSYKTTWNYYGYNSKSPMNTSIPIMNGTASGTYSLEPIPAPDFNGSTATFALRYAF